MRQKEFNLLVVEVLDRIGGQIIAKWDDKEDAENTCNLVEKLLDACKSEHVVGRTTCELARQEVISEKDKP